MEISDEALLAMLTEFEKSPRCRSQIAKEEEATVAAAARDIIRKAFNDRIAAAVKVVREQVKEREAAIAAEIRIQAAIRKQALLEKDMDI